MSKKYILFLAVMLTANFLMAQDWVQKSNIPGPARHHPVTWGIGDYGYALTGANAQNTPLKDFYRYDAQNDSWVQLSDFPGAARSYSIGAVYNDIGYIGFGSTATSYLNDLWSYNPVNEQWTQLASCPCAGREHPSFVAHDGKVYAGLGASTSNLRDWWEYDISSDSWTQMPDLPGPPRHHPFHFAVGDYVYAGMGHGNGPGTNIYDDWYRFNPSTKTWTQMNDFPGQGRVAGTQFHHGNHGYVLSGDGEDHSFMATGEFWKYDADTDSWEQLPPTESRWAPNSFVVHNKVYFTSGVNKLLGLIYNDVWSYPLSYCADNQTVSIDAGDSLFVAGDWQTTSGTYYDTVASVTACDTVMITELTINNPVSIQHLSNSLFNFSVFPNPVQEELHVQPTHAISSETIMEIFDICGRLVAVSQWQPQIQLKGLKSGLYILRITDEMSNQFNSRFQKQ